jgi:hypothetical protein
MNKLFICLIILLNGITIGINCVGLSLPIKNTMWHGSWLLVITSVLCFLLWCVNICSKKDC